MALLHSWMSWDLPHSFWCFALFARYCPPLAGQNFDFSTIIFLIVLTGGNQLYYTAFNNWAGLYSLGQINELGAIKSSVNSMLPYDVIVLWFCVPLLMLIAFAKPGASGSPAPPFKLRSPAS